MYRVLLIKYANFGLTACFSYVMDLQGNESILYVILRNMPILCRHYVKCILCKIFEV